jgi:drug/metabolite transporter (DMT)-like permease
VAAIVAGIAVVAVAGEAEKAGGAHNGRALLWAVLGACGFSLTYAFGQAAVLRAADPAAIWPVLWMGRAATLAVLLAVALIVRAPLSEARPNLPTLALMGALDAVGLGLVLASGWLRNPEYASVTSALFGVLTILLAWRVLGERVLPAQWAGIAVVFSGIGLLAALPA